MSRYNDLRPIFVVGNSRSGTTMMANILGRNQAVHMFPEIHFWEQCYGSSNESVLLIKQVEQLARRLLAISRTSYLTYRTNSLDLPDVTRDARLLALSIEQEYQGRSAIDVLSVFLRFETSKNGKSTPCCQTPRNQFYIKEILGAFPGARFIYMIRDPKDILLSQKRRWRLNWKKHRLREAIRAKINYHPITISMLWKSSIKNYLHNKDRVYTVFYEQIVADPNVEVKIVCDYLGLEFEPEMLQVEQVGSSLDASEYQKVGKGISKKSVGAWRRGGLNSTELFICQIINGKLMKQLGYKTVRTLPNPILIIFYLFTFPVKICVAFLANLGRMKSIRATIAKRLNFK